MLPESTGDRIPLLGTRSEISIQPTNKEYLNAYKQHSSRNDRFCSLLTSTLQALRHKASRKDEQRQEAERRLSIG